MIPTTAVQNYLKQILAPRVEEQYAKETPLLSNLNKNVGVQKINDKFLITVVKGLHSGVAGVGKGATLPTGYADTARVEIAPTYLFVGFSIYDQDLETARTDAQTLANILTINEDQMRTAMSRQLNRMFFQNGAYNGAVTTANGAGVTSTTLTITNAGDVDFSEYFAPGMYIVIGTAAPVQIASVDSTTQLTLAQARSWSSADKIYITGPDGETGKEPDGLAAAIGLATNTFQTIARTTNPWWISTLSGTATYSTDRALEKKLQELCLKANRYGKIQSIFTNISGYQRLLADQQSLQRVVGYTELKGGFMGLSFMANGYMIPVVMDRDVPDKQIYGVDFDALTLAQLAPIQWLDQDMGGNILRLNGKAVWEGFLKYYVNLGLRRARGNFAITDGTFTV